MTINEIPQTQIYPTTNSELAAWLILCGCEVASVERINPHTSLINLKYPDGQLQEWLRQFENYDGNARIARDMFKAHRGLLKIIKKGYPA